ncbi:MAG: SIS domain-containing protein [Treponema sp.]|jgi:6-phospho-3-hexuloisomerase|nr:SIS domain-containing protein [Treponema sp.]
MTAKDFEQASTAIVNEISICVKQLDFSPLEVLLREMQSAKRIFCIGAGRSGIMLQAFCMRLNHLGLQAFMLGTVSCPPTEPGDLVIAASGSGENAGVVAILQKAKKLGAKTAAFTASSNAGIEPHTDTIIRICAPNGLVNDGKCSSQPMRTLFEQVSFITYEVLIALLRKQCGTSEREMAERHANLE